MNFYYGTLIVSHCILVIAFVVGTVKYSNLIKTSRWFFYYLGFLILLEATNEILISLVGIDNTNFMYPYYIAGEFFLLANMLVVGINLSKKWRILVWLITVSLFVEALIKWLNDPRIVSELAKTISHFIIICALGFVLIKSMIEQDRRKNTFLMIYGALFMYYLVSMFLFLLLNQLPNLIYESAYVIWGMNNALTILLYGVSLYTFLRLKK